MIEIERLSEDKLSCQVWRFSVDAGIGSGDAAYVRLQFYAQSTRPTTRHKFKFEPSDRFIKSDQRRYNSGISADDVPLPNDIAIEAAAGVQILVVDAAQKVRT